MGSLFDEIGDAATLRTAVNLFYRRVLADPGLAPWFGGVDMTALRAHQLAFLADALGGPDLFSGRDIAAAHAGLGITDQAFDELIGHLATALRDLGKSQSMVDRVVRRLEPLRHAVVDDATVSPPAAAPNAAPPGS
ncbi:group 1 truncated hemoglobin [Cryptosporangium sp. NPDC051539]|uniref:group 1 truncated hemoglobin n=1 Tax=Cryptosporangium sp. NPDC051539 TaxID=3363962 RepID=UPI003796B871